VHGCLAMLIRIRDLAEAGSQFVVATHSPILLAVPQARILQIDVSGAISEVSYDEAEPVVLTRSFLADPQRYVHYLFNDDG
jgi:predicted ATPase